MDIDEVFEQIAQNHASLKVDDEKYIMKCLEDSTKLLFDILTDTVDENYKQTLEGQMDARTEEIINTRK